MRFAGVCIFLAKFFLALLDPVPCTQVRSPSKKIECFVENFLAEENIARFVIMNWMPDTLAVLLSFCFCAGCFCFLEMFKFTLLPEQFTWGANHNETKKHWRNASHVFLLAVFRVEYLSKSKEISALYKSFQRLVNKVSVAWKGFFSHIKKGEDSSGDLSGDKRTRYILTHWSLIITKKYCNLICLLTCRKLH